MKVKINNSFLMNEVKKQITENINKKVVHQIMCDNEPIRMCDTIDEANEIVDKLKKENPGKNFLIEKKVYKSHEDMINKLDELSEKMENLKEGKKITQILLKQQTNETDCVDCNYKINEGNLCEGCGDVMNEEGLCPTCSKKMNKSKKIRVTESELIDIIENIIKENVPGINTYNKSHASSGKSNKSHLKDVDTKIKKSLSFDNNDNPEFPKAIGKGTKKAKYNSKEENDDVAFYRGGTLLDLNYDYEPDEKFKERVKKSLIGDKTMGNGTKDAANVIKTNTGENLIKDTDKKKQNKKKQVMYNKEPQPVKVVKESINEDIKKMKKLISFK
jgi:hypothetical protein